MAASGTGKPAQFTVGSLIPGWQPPAEALPLEAPNWAVSDGVVRQGAPLAGYTAAGVERLHYNNPYGQTMERVWFDGKIVFAIDVGRVEVDVSKVKVAQEYQVVYAVDLDEELKLRAEPELVPDQLNIYDSVPGMAKYSPLWQFNYVIVPRGYAPNTLRSERDCLASGYEIRRSNVVEN
ncbi:MAG TPA: hypothetical protein VKV26_16625 [Dehalococcoidia bacterium]|nr:hypothetical protein [Dehalococcoidia bacterium]